MKSTQKQPFMRTFCTRQSPQRKCDLPKCVCVCVQEIEKEEMLRFIRDEELGGPFHAPDFEGSLLCKETISLKR